MTYVALVLLVIIAFSAVGISGSLKRLADHHLRFPPPSKRDTEG